MTQSHSVTNREVWSISGPMMLANVSTPLLGLVDTAVVGHLDSPIYLGAVAIGAMIFSFLYWGFGFLRMVTTGLTAQAKSQIDSKNVLLQSAWLAVIIALSLILLQTPISWLAFHFVNATPSVNFQAEQYFDIRIWSAPATLLNYAIMGWLIGKALSKQVLFIAVIINLSNIFLDLALVNGLGMKADGVALASVIAEYIGLFLGICILFKLGIRIKQNNWTDSFIKLYENRNALSLHLNFMIRTLCLIFSFAFFTNQGARQGEIVLAANMVLLNFITFMAYVLDAFANATETLSGQAIANHNKQRFLSTLRITTYWAFFASLAFSMMYLIFGQNIISVLTSIDEVKITALDYQVWLIIAPVIAVWSYLLDGLFVGATMGKAMRNTMLAAVFIFYLPAWWFLQPFGNHGLWAALLIFLAARGLCQSLFLPKIVQLKFV